MAAVPNPLPKVLSRRVGAGMEAAERESFERTPGEDRGGVGMPPPGHARLGHPAVSWRGLEGSRDLAGPGKDSEQGGIWCGGQGGSGSGPGAIPAGLGRGWLRSSWHGLRGATDRSRSRRGQGRGHGGGERGRNAKRGRMEGAPSWEGPWRGVALGVASVAAERGAESGM